jgi:hypothetical protein
VLTRQLAERERFSSGVSAYWLAELKNLGANEATQTKMAAALDRLNVTMESR